MEGVLNLIELIAIITFLIYILLKLATKAVFSIDAYFIANATLIFISVVLIINSIHNSIYTISELYHRYYGKIKYRKKSKLSLLKLKLTSQRNIAVFVPAWQEANVIDKMVENIVEKADYQNYTIFIGTYPNDLETQKQVDKVALKHPQIKKVVTAKPGPTSKSDCLNNIYKFMQEYEKKNNIHFDTIILHDAEDIVHPYEFLLANYFLLIADAVQIPILPLPAKWYQLVHWVYADEFAIFQLKDSFVREKNKGFVPFAGVGMCLTRRALEKYQKSFNTSPFPEHSLTEDYLLANRLNQLGLRVLFLRVTLKDESLNSRKAKIYSKRKYFICNWAYFPMNFKRSVKQKARWMTGIVFQSWEELGWKGNLRIKENLYKDRRMVIDQVINVLAYTATIYFILFHLSDRGIINIKIPDIINGNQSTILLCKITLIFFVKDMIEKAYIVSTVYGPLQGMLSIPRTILANIINTLAAFHACRTYIIMKRGNKVTWDKTDHVEGLGVLDVEANIQPKHNNANTYLNRNDIIAYLYSRYSGCLETISTWSITHIQLSKDALDYLIQEKSNLFSLYILSLTLEQIEPRVQERIICNCLNSGNITLINNVLEYLYKTDKISEYYPVLLTKKCKLARTMYINLKNNRSL